MCSHGVAKTHYESYAYFYEDFNRIQQRYLPNNVSIIPNGLFIQSSTLGIVDLTCFKNEYDKQHQQEVDDRI